MPPLSLILLHPETNACAPFRHRFAHLPRAAVLQSTYESAPAHDCFVTAGNSFGIMTAGIDAAVVAFLGRDVMTTVQNHIRMQFLGEQPVGTAFLVPARHEHIKFLNHAPTMRVPGSIDGTDRV